MNACWMHSGKNWSPDCDIQTDQCMFFDQGQDGHTSYQAWVHKNAGLYAGRYTGNSEIFDAW